MENIIKKRTKDYAVPRFVSIISKRLNMNFQPGYGSSIYRTPSKKRIPENQKDWISPLGTLRLSDHWGYENISGKVVYCTNIEVPNKTWALCINTGENSKKPWKVLKIFQEQKGVNIIRNIDFKLIEAEIKEAVAIN